MNIENYQDQSGKQILALFYPENDARYERKLRLWNWQYFENPCTSDTRGFILLEDNKIGGFHGLMPVDLMCQGQPVKAYWGCDLLVSSLFRGKGCGIKLVQKFISSRPILLSMGVSDAAAVILKKLNFKVNTEVELYIYQQRAGNFEDFLKIIIQYFRRLTSGKLLERQSLATPYTAYVSDIIELRQEAIDQLWERSKNDYGKIAIRDYAYLNWKYARHPALRYAFIFVEHNHELVGLGIYRAGKQEAVLVDYVGPKHSIEIKYRIVKMFRARCKTAGMLLCLCSDQELKAILESEGFRRYKERPRFYIYSNRPDDENAHQNWFVMKGDSDCDLNSTND